MKAKDIYRMCKGHIGWAKWGQRHLSKRACKNWHSGERERELDKEAHETEETGNDNG